MISTEADLAAELVEMRAAMLIAMQRARAAIAAVKERSAPVDGNRCGYCRHRLSAGSENFCPDCGTRVVRFLTRKTAGFHRCREIRLAFDEKPVV